MNDQSDAVGEVMVILENCPSGITGKSEVILKFLLKNVTKQCIEIKIITCFC
jgi:hypothetical protein